MEADNYQNVFIMMKLYCGGCGNEQIMMNFFSLVYVVWVFFYEWGTSHP